MLLGASLLLKCYIRPTRCEDLSAEEVGYLKTLIIDGFIESDDRPEPGVYVVTEKGKTYCEAVRQLPFPIAVWVMPPVPPR